MRVDINTKIIGNDFQVYSLFPGEGYKHRQTMINENVVFLDFPDLDIPTTQSGFSKAKFINSVVQSASVSSWISQGKPVGSNPAHSPQSFLKSKRTQKRMRYVNALEGLFAKAKRGEVVLLPDRGHYGELLIGEFIGEPSDVTYTVVNGHKYPSRKVKWMGKKSQHKLSAEFLRSIRTANPLVIVERSKRRPFYEAAYQSFILGDDISAKFLVGGESFNSRDDLLLQQLINYVAALYEDYDEEKVVAGATREGMFETILGMSDPDTYSPDLTMNINSPGYISLLSEKLTPIVVATIFALAVSACGPAGTVPQDLTNTVIELSISGVDDDPCAIAVKDIVSRSINAMGYDNWQNVCKIAKELTGTAEVKAPATVLK